MSLGQIQELRKQIGGRVIEQNCRIITFKQIKSWTKI